MRHAIEVGATVCEVDVRHTQDAQLIIMHDTTMDRTTDGHGTVSAMPLRAVERLEAGLAMGCSVIFARPCIFSTETHDKGNTQGCV